MTDASDQSLLDVLLDSWDRNNPILLNLLRILPENGLEVRATERTIRRAIVHPHPLRTAGVRRRGPPEIATRLPVEEWAAERDRNRIAQMLTESAKAVRDAVKTGSRPAAK